MIIQSMIFILLLIIGVPSTGSCGDVTKVILLESMTLHPIQEQSRWFLEQMSDMGYREGENLKLLRLNGDGSKEKLGTLFDNALTTFQPDLVVTNATLASQLVKKRLRGTEIPQLFFFVSDPVGSGLIESIGKPSGINITGIIHSVPQDTIIEIIMMIADANSLPRPMHFGYFHTDYPSSNGDIKQLTAAASQRKDVVFVSKKLPYREGVQGETSTLQEISINIGQLENEIDFWWQPLGPLGINQDYTRLLIEQSTAPIMYGSTQNSVKMGALVNISATPETHARETARIADTILKGKNAGEIPSVWAGQLQVSLNLSTSITLKLTIPSEVLEMAGNNLFY